MNYKNFTSKYIYLALGIILLISVSSCEKEIDIKVKGAQPKTVIEAIVSNQPGQSYVHLSKSQNLDDDSMAPIISDAIVTITDQNTQEQFILDYFAEGIYTHENLIGIPGNTYQLQVELSTGQVYTSLSTMPLEVVLDNVMYELADEAIQDDETEDDLYKISPEFNDPAGIDNYYQIRVLRNEELDESINVFKDLGFDGLPNTQEIYVDATPGDTLNIELQNLSLDAYTYMFGVFQNINQNTASPTNPISNIQGDALGYFKVYSASEGISLEIQ